MAQSLAVGGLGLLLFINPKRNSESPRMAGREEGGSWELVLLLPLSVLGLLVAGEGLCVPRMARRTFITLSFFLKQYLLL